VISGSNLAAICRELVVIGYGHGTPLRDRAALTAAG
jgi:hypothetical protein